MKRKRHFRHTSSKTAREDSQQTQWWRGGVVYQIYPRSFHDFDGNGIGDLRGITAKLPYVASLGVDAVWISPFFTSPMNDFGYDISDYRDVDPMFGTVKDFDKLVATAHRLGLKVMIDQVLSHTSDQHPWFIQSRKSRSNTRAGWYVWADPKPDGCPPNNWLSVFGGSAWQWDSVRQQYYLHNFLTSQPDLNFHNPAVRREILRCMEFWLERGVDGFRLDACNFHFCDKKLRDNPPSRGGPVFSVPLSNPYSRQEHIYDKSRPENLAFLREVRRLFDRYGAVSMGEIGDERAVELMAQYTKGHDRLHMAYSFNLLTDDYSAAYIRDQVSQFESKMSDGWGAWSVGNHDVKRVLSRWGVGRVGEDRDQINAFVRQIITLVGTLRGSVCWYQGDELGLIEGDVPFDKIQDPYGKTFWPKFKGRDGCRTPMPWDSSKPHAGFSAVPGHEPWLPVVEQHTQNAVEVCEGDPDSSLHFMRSFLRWRKKQPELVEGAIRWISNKEPLLGYVRYLPEDRDTGILVLLNLGPKFRSAEIPGGTVVPVLEHGMPVKQFGKLGKRRVSMPPFGVFLARVTLS